MCARSVHKSHPIWSPCLPASFQIHCRDQYIKSTNSAQVHVCLFDHTIIFAESTNFKLFPLLIRTRYKTMSHLLINNTSQGLRCQTTKTTLF